MAPIKHRGYARNFLKTNAIASFSKTAGASASAESSRGFAGAEQLTPWSQLRQRPANKRAYRNEERNNAKPVGEFRGARELLRRLRPRPLKSGICKAET